MRRLVHDATAAVCVVLLLAAIPIVLVHVGGWPPPHDLPDPSQVYGPAAVRPAVITAGFTFAWIVWAALLATVITRVIAAAGRALAALPRLPPPRPLQTPSAPAARTIAGPP